MFGFGMVLASGCGSKTLVRVGGGNLKSLVVFVVLGVSAFATLKGLTAVWRVATVDRVAATLPAGQDLPSLLAQGSGVAPRHARRCCWACWSAARCWRGRWRGPRGGAATCCSVASASARSMAAVWWVSGRLGHVAEHPLTLQESFLATNSQRMESLSFVVADRLHASTG